MASFIQPGAQDPDRDGCKDSSRFQIYCNTLIPSASMFRNLYQLVGLTMGATCIAVPLLLYLIYLYFRRPPSSAHDYNKDTASFGEKRRHLQTERKPEGSTESACTSSRKLEAPSFGYIRSFHVIHNMRGACEFQKLSKHYDLVVIPLTINGCPRHSSQDIRSLDPCLNHDQITAKLKLAYICMEDLRHYALEKSDTPETAQYLASIQNQNKLQGFALQCTNTRTLEKTDTLLQCLASLQVPVVLLCQHDCEAIDHLDLSLTSGIIMENACILPDGERRDYFKARRLRDVMERCRVQRDKRPSFFVGFSDVWEIRPKASVVRRAAKIAEHFGAVMEHGPAHPAMDVQDGGFQSPSKTISAFEYLRLPEMVEMQRRWILGERKTKVLNDGKNSKILPFSLDSLDLVLPTASALLEHFDISPKEQPTLEETIITNQTTGRTRQCPKRTSLWGHGVGNIPFSSRGCFPLTCEPTDAHFNTIVKSQDHLRELGMLEAVEGHAEQKLLESIRNLMPYTKHQTAIQELIDGLFSQRIHVFRGLKTGFRIPRADVSFWGVSKDRYESEAAGLVDIYISLVSPDDAAVILHTWLAHKGISRQQRFEEELEFENSRSSNHSFQVPVTIRESIHRATYAELLSLTQRLRVSEVNHPIAEATDALCRSALIDDTTRAAWRRRCALAAIDDSLSMRELLEQRLIYLTGQGADRLPTLDNLCSLHDEITDVVEDALLLGNRHTLQSLIQTLQSSYGVSRPQNESSFVDTNAELFALITFTVFRRAAFEDVYMETTDRCPLFLGQPDQAAVFSELWILGSQCEIYFDLLPRDIGHVIYTRYCCFLESDPPNADYRRGNEIMTMYPSSDELSYSGDEAISIKHSTKQTIQNALCVWKENLASAGAMSIFCLPAVIDVTMLTFLGRGLFMTAFLDSAHIEVAGHALLASILLTAGITGWVGSVGNFYMAHYAYDNMIYFHVQRMSGGFFLSLAIAICGLVAFSLTKSVSAGFVFAAYMICISTYLNILGVLSTMHLYEAPLTSGRKLILQTLPLLLISPILSTFINGHDLAIYFPVMYTFLIIILYRYRRLCEEWSSWMDNIPRCTEKQILDWYTDQLSSGNRQEDEPRDDLKGQDIDIEAARDAFTAAVTDCSHNNKVASIGNSKPDTLIRCVSKGLPYIEWLLKKTSSQGAPPQRFTTAWFTQLSEAINQQQQVRRGLKEHSAFTLLRLSRHDVGQNLGLFLVALLDRCIILVMSADQPHPDSRSRYGIWLAIVYFCLSAMILDITLQKYWSHRYEVSHDKLAGIGDFERIQCETESRRRTCILKALMDLLTRLLVLFGCTTIFLWLLVESMETIVHYYMNVFGYTCAIIFLFNRCFTTNIGAHVTAIMVSIAIGFTLGCVMHALPETRSFLYKDIIAQNVAALLAALGTSYFAWKDDIQVPVKVPSSTEDFQFIMHKKISSGNCDDVVIETSSLPALSCPKIMYNDGSALSEKLTQLLFQSLEDLSCYAQSASWSDEILREAQDTWCNNKIVILLSTTDQFREIGLGKLSSFSYNQYGVLNIVLGSIGESDSKLRSWQPVVSTIACEALLYHLARSEFKLCHQQALEAEHFVYGTDSLSQRVQLEIATSDHRDRNYLALNTEAKLMGHLCLGIDVNSKWETTPQVIRELILDRICGDGATISTKASRWTSAHGINIQNQDFHATLTLEIYRLCKENPGRNTAKSNQKSNSTSISSSDSELRVVSTEPSQKRSAFRRTFTWIVQVCSSVAKWIAIISGGASNVERELFYIMGNFPLKTPLLYLLLLLWHGCWIIRNLWIYWLIIHHKPALANITRLAKKGERRKIKLRRGAIVVEQPRETVTGFVSREDESMVLTVYKGTFSEVPKQQPSAFSAIYDEDSRLRMRIEEGNSRTVKYHYDPDTSSRQPVRMESKDSDIVTIGHYDQHGRVINGSMLFGNEEITFQYFYRNIPYGNYDLLRADYKLVGSQDNNSMSVFWGKPVDPACYDWVPSENVHRITQSLDGKKYVTEYEYQHRRDPSIVCYMLEGETKTVLVQRPQLFSMESRLLQRPRNISFQFEDLLSHHSISQIKQMCRQANHTPTWRTWINPSLWFPRRNRRLYQRVPTWLVRTELWNHWSKTSTLDACTACWVDEIILREEPLLQRYWRARDRGLLEQARQALDDNIDQIASAIDMQIDVSEISLLAIKTSDLYAMGLGNDANPVTSQPQNCYSDTKDRISVIFNDIGCWPISPGGVSNCRRDLVNGHSTIRNHVIAECANEFGIPRFQIEKNVQSMKLLPLWGLDGNTACHGVIDNLLESEVDDKIASTDLEIDVIGTFVPLLTEFVKGARTKRHSRADLIKYSNVMLSMSEFYETKDYSLTWKSREVERAWIRAWLITYNDPNIANASEYFEMEQPSMSDFRDALNLYLAYLFIYTVKVPNDCPRVFQSTHHGMSSLYGMILQFQKDVTFGIWDHAIYWRESCLNISLAQCALPISVQSMLLAGIRMASRLAYLHADVIIPCASVFNPMWEIEMGTDGGTMSNKNMFERKIDPIVNGISNMDAFEPADKVRTDKPTVVMLSNVQFIKGVKIAIQAADIIINQMGFEDYQLVVYGAKDRQPSYTIEMEKIIADSGLSGKVILAGFGNPKLVLQDAWLFMNSSLSEGLPLAIGEAALAGVPIVATEVGATALVLTDPVRPEQQYGEVVPPNDPMALARAQLSILSMVGPWSKFTSDSQDKPPVLPGEILPEHARWLTGRFYEKASDRRKLGLLCREVVLQSFHGSRYLREHEQMYWIQWYMSKMRKEEAGECHA